MTRPDYREIQYLSHSAKGSTWSKHKYIRKENGRYVYPSDLKDSSNKKQQTTSERISDRYKRYAYQRNPYGYVRQKTKTPGGYVKSYAVDKDIDESTVEQFGRFSQKLKREKKINKMDSNISKLEKSQSTLANRKKAARGISSAVEANKKSVSSQNSSQKSLKERTGKTAAQKNAEIQVKKGMKYIESKLKKKKRR